MADSDPRNTVDEEDLEDGEIETDEENDVASEKKPAKPVVIEPVKKIKENDTKNVSDAKPKVESHKSAPDNAAKNKKASGDPIPKGK